MGTIDLHVHTNKSPCGLHSLLEILELARQRQMELVAITDHDLGQGASTRVLSYRFPKQYNGVRVLAGMEFSIRDNGEILVPRLVRLDFLDICLAGFHEEGRKVKNDPVRCTDDLEAALERSPFIDILTHPTIAGFNLEHERCAGLLAKHDVAVEINNSALLYGKEQEDQVLSLLAACKAHQVQVAVNSDTHTAPELGRHDQALAVLQKANLAPQQILTRSVESVLQFVQQRKARKQALQAT